MDADIKKDAAWASFAKPRGVRACLADAWRAYALQPGRFVGFLLAPLLLSGLAFAAAGYMAARLQLDFLLPLRLLAEAAGGGALLPLVRVLPAEAWMWAGGALLAAAAGLFAWGGAAAAQVRFVQRSGALPGVCGRGPWADVPACGGRALLMAAVVLVVPAVAVALAARPGAAAWRWLLPAVVAAYVLPTGAAAFVAYVVERRPLRSSLRVAVGGFRRLFGGFLLIGLLASVLLVPVALAASLPALTLLLSAGAGAMSSLMGDAAGAMPAAAVGLWFLCATAVGAFVLLNATLVLWAFSYRLAADGRGPEQQP